MAVYLGSNDIKVFPSAFRGDNIDTTSFLMSEGNISNISGKASSIKNFLCNVGESSFGICIGGYYFEVSVSDITSKFSTSIDTSKPIYAGIKIEDLHSSSNVDMSTLVAVSGGQSDHLLDINNEFKGLAFSQTRDELTSTLSCSETLKVLEYDNNAWKVCEGSKAKHKAEDICIQYASSGDDEDNRHKLSDYVTVDTNKRKKVDSYVVNTTNLVVSDDINTKNLRASTNITSEGTINATGKITGANNLEITGTAKIGSNGTTADITGTTTKAIADKSGNVIDTTYINGIQPAHVDTNNTTIGIEYTKPGIGSATFVDLLNLIYPIGSIYMSVNDVNPSTLFGGTWIKIEGRFLLASSSSYALGTTGGVSSTSLKSTNLPAHTHSFTGNSANIGGGSHTHSFSGNTGNASGSTTASFCFRAAGSDNLPIVGISGGFASITNNYSESMGLSMNLIGSSGNPNSDKVNLNISSHTHSFSGSTTTGEGSHTHSYQPTGSVSGGGNGTTTGTSFTNMPPYLVVNVWQRVADDYVQSVASTSTSSSSSNPFDVGNTSGGSSNTTFPSIDWSNISVGDNNTGSEFPGMNIPDGVELNP